MPSFLGTYVPFMHMCDSCHPVLVRPFLPSLGVTWGDRVPSQKVLSAVGSEEGSPALRQAGFSSASTARLGMGDKVSMLHFFMCTTDITIVPTPGSWPLPPGCTPLPRTWTYLQAFMRILWEVTASAQGHSKDPTFHTFCIQCLKKHHLVTARHESNASSINPHTEENRTKPTSVNHGTLCSPFGRSHSPHLACLLSYLK